MDDRVIGHARAERVVLGTILRGGALTLLRFVRASAGVRPRLARRGRRHLDRPARDTTTA